MIRFHPQEAQASLDAVTALGLLAPAELAAVQQVMTDVQIRPAIALAESVHLHIKVDDTERLPQAGMEALGARLDHGREGFVKFRFPGGLNVIFSHIAVSADDLQESPALPARAAFSRPHRHRLARGVRSIEGGVRCHAVRGKGAPVGACRAGWRGPQREVLPRRGRGEALAFPSCRADGAAGSDRGCLRAAA